MPRSLSADALARYRERGYHFPIRVMSEVQAAGGLARLEAYEASQGGRLAAPMRQKAHLLLTWLADLVRHPAILDAVEEVLGADILCWQSNFFIKDAGDPGFVSWHQDGHYWGLSAPEVVTAWLAFTPSNPASGCMRVIPGSHRQETVPHRDTYADHNLLTRGQEIAVAVDESQAVDLVLAPGEISLHHVRIFHASKPNRAPHRRIGLAMRYVAPHVRQLSGVPDSATLVRGEDRYGHFEPEPRPAQDLAPRALELHRQVVTERGKYLYREMSGTAPAGGGGNA